MSWYKPKVRKVTFEEFGAPELEIEILDINSLPYGQAKRLQREWSSIAAKGEAATLEEQDPALRMVLVELIHSWNITDPVTEQPMPLPKEKPEIIEELPMDLLMFIASNAFGVGAEEAVPPANGNVVSISSPAEPEVAQVG